MLCTAKQVQSGVPVCCVCANNGAGGRLPHLKASIGTLAALTADLAAATVTYLRKCSPLNKPIWGIGLGNWFLAQACEASEYALRELPNDDYHIDVDHAPDRVGSIVCARISRILWRPHVG